MKRIYTVFLLVISSVILVACASTSQMKESKEQAEATIIIQIEGEEIDKKVVAFQEGTVLYDIMAANFDIEAQDGFITSINQKKQDTKAKKYWLYDVNEEMAVKGAKDLVIKSGDTVLFKMEQMK